MTKTLEVVVLDDQGAFRSKVADTIKQAFPQVHVGGLSSQDLVTALTALHERQIEARKSPTAQRQRIELELDRADIVIVDFDLTGIDKLAIAHGADVAYLARCYSGCGIIVLLNRHGDNRFDLTLARGSDNFRELNHVDLDLGVKQIGCAYLWSGRRDGSFAPWAWSDLPSAVARLRERTRWIKAHLDEAVAATLEPLLNEALPRELHATLALRGARMTWAEWADSEACRRKRDSLASSDDKARVAAARIGNWLDHMVLPGQDVLVDAPHLISRYPALLKDPSAHDQWNSTTNTGAVTSALKHLRALREHVFPDWKRWLSRPAWVWPRLRDAAQGQPWEMMPQKGVDVVFCEDTGTFCPNALARPFLSRLQTPFTRRYVRQVGKVDYEPRVRLLDGRL